MADKIKFIEGTDSAIPGAFYVRGTGAKVGSHARDFRAADGRPATPEEIAELREAEEAE